MGNSNGKQKKMEITDSDRAILALKTQRRRLEDQRQRVINQMDKEELIARQLLATGHRDRALLAMKKRKIQQHTLGKLDSFLLNIETMLANVETSVNQVRVTTALQQANDAMKEIQRTVQLEDIEKLMEDSAEATDYLQQLKVLLGQSLTNEDEAASEAELRQLEREVTAEMKEEMPSVPQTEESVILLPSVPQHEPGVVSSSGSREKQNESALLAA